MSLETFQTLGVVLLFLAPGAWFIWLLTLSYSPTARKEYISRQFPLELTLHYLLVSVLIHSVLLIICALVVYGIMTVGQQPDIIQKWCDLLTKPTMLPPNKFLIVMSVALGYLIAGFALASLLTILLKDRLLLPEALWASEFMKLLPKDVQVDIEVMRRGGKIIKGRLVSFQPMGGIDFELLLAQANPNQKDVLIWIPSKLIQVLHCETDVKKWTFLFSSEEGLSRQRQLSVHRSARTRVRARYK